MTPDVVVDIGNSRVKWGWCRDGRVASMTPLPPDDPDTWDVAIDLSLDGRVCWAVAGVHPERLARFRDWAVMRGDDVLVIDRYDQLPISVDVEYPERVGIDRLLNAVAAHRIAKPNPAIVIDVGTAVTGDVVADGRFLGGAIFPGPRLMAESLNRFTVKLPLVNAPSVPTLHPPGKNTEAAILAGIRYAIIGAAYLLVDQYAALGLGQPWVLMTGGALGDLAEVDFGDDFGYTRTVPTLTLDGIRIAAEALP